MNTKDTIFFWFAICSQATEYENKSYKLTSLMLNLYLTWIIVYIYIYISLFYQKNKQTNKHNIST
jgi:threonine/homoserine/homoserine lactone efflux protein